MLRGIRSLRSPGGSARAGSRTWLFSTTLTSPLWAGLLLRQQVRPQRKVPQAGSPERVDGVLRRADDGLAVEIERGVQDRRDAGSVLEFSDQLRVAAAAVYELRSRRLVRRVKGGDEIFASLFCRRERDHHVVCRDSFWIAHVTVGVVFQDAGRERHPEVAVFYL